MEHHARRSVFRQLTTVPPPPFQSAGLRARVPRSRDSRPRSRSKIFAFFFVVFLPGEIREFRFRVPPFVSKFEAKKKRKKKKQIRGSNVRARARDQSRERLRVGFLIMFSRECARSGTL